MIKMNEKNIQKIQKEQQVFFRSGRTLPVENRIQVLKALKKNIKAHERDVYRALKEDLGKSESESYMCEIGLVYGEIDHMVRHVKRYARKQRRHTPLAQAVSTSYVLPVPKGNVLIMSPWNYPFLLALDPLVDALAAGNVAVVKPSAYAPCTGEVVRRILEETFPEGYVAVVTGGRAENQALLDQKFHHIFFTGSQSVGKEVMKKAADYLTSVTLELGGKSPCIVDKTADLKIAAKRIVFGKYLNCGQTCVAPDYIFCEHSIAEELKKQMVLEIKKQFGEHPLENRDYGKIINEKHFSRLCKLLEQETVYYGGGWDREKLKIEPSILSPCNVNSGIMEDEIFGPLLPVITYTDLDFALKYINSRPHPLALYIFSRDREAIRKVTQTCGYGGGCVNDTVIHLATPHMGFGGFQESGMGSYHGKDGFDTFTNYKSIVDKKTWLDLPMRYQPYTRLKDRIVHLFLK